MSKHLSAPVAAATDDLYLSTLFFDKRNANCNKKTNECKKKNNGKGQSDQCDYSEQAAAAFTSIKKTQTVLNAPGNS